MGSLYFLAANAVPNSENVREAKAKYWLATDRKMTSDMAEQRLVYPHLLVAMNEITGSMEETIVQMAQGGAQWLIDSGVYFLATDHAKAHGITMNEALSTAPENIDGFEDLYDRYVQFIRRNEQIIWGYIEIDMGGRENKMRTRARLENDEGLHPIPVYHPLNDGWDYFDYLADHYERMCVGNIVYAPPEDRKRILATLWERKRKYPRLWIHLLGYTPNVVTLSYPMDSMDSSSWLAPLRWRRMKPMAMLRTVGQMPHDYMYVVGDVDRQNASYGKAVAVTAYDNAMMLRNWGNFSAELVELGADLGLASR